MIVPIPVIASVELVLFLTWLFLKLRDELRK